MGYYGSYCMYTMFGGGWMVFSQTFSQNATEADCKCIACQN